MDPLERLLRDANPVPNTADTPFDPGEQLESLRSELRNTRVTSGRNQAKDVVGAARRGILPRRLIPVLAAMTLVLGLAAAGFGAAVIWLSTTSPAPVGSPSSTSTPADDWRLVGFAPGPDASETRVDLKLPKGWELITSLPHDDYPARSGHVNLLGPTSQASFAMPQIMIYYGPYGPSYNPAACAGPEESFVELDSSPVNIPYDASVPGTVSPRFVYRVANGERLVASFGITTQPPSTSIDSCNHYFQVRAARAGYFFTFSSYSTYVQGNPGWLSPVQRPATVEFGSLEEARAFLETDEYATIKRIFSSLSISAP